MRDAMAVQRRRRLMLLKSDAASVTNGHGPASDSTLSPPNNGNGFATGLEAADLCSMREQLFDECHGRREAQLLIEIPGKVPPTRFDLDRPFLLVGSDPACDLWLDHPGIRPRHAYLQWLSGQLYCCDLGENADRKTTRNARQSHCWLDGQPWQIGPCRLSLVGDAPHDVPAFHPLERSPQLAAEFPQVRLKFEGVEQADNQWPVDRLLTLVGRGSQCKLRLDHPDMPPVLASLLRTPTGCWLIDLAGQGTMLLNGHPVCIAPLDIGDELQLGPFLVEVTTSVFGSAERTASRTVIAEPNKGLVEMATRHRQLVAELNRLLLDVQSYLDAELLEETPRLKIALEKYVNQATQHHREMFESLERLVMPVGVTESEARLNGSASSASVPVS